MKKLIKHVQLLLIFCFSCSSIWGQSSTGNTTRNSIIKDAKRIIGTEVNNEISQYKFLDFGSIMEGSSNKLNIVPKLNIIYTKAELLNAERNKTIMSISISEDSDAIDLTGVPQGNYLLILTNSDGHINVEKLTIL